MAFGWDDALMLVVSAYSAQQASSAGRAAERSNKATDAAIRDEMRRYGQYYEPMERQLSTDLMQPVEYQPGLSAALSEIERGAATRGASVRRTMAGRAPTGSGLEYSGQMTNRVAADRARAGVYTDAAEGRFQRMLQFVNMGRGIPGQQIGNMVTRSGNESEYAMQAGAGAGESMGNMLNLLYLLGRGGGGGGGSTGVRATGDYIGNG